MVAELHRQAGSSADELSLPILSADELQHLACNLWIWLLNDMAKYASASDFRAQAKK